jgi:hypothetical protein
MPYAPACNFLLTKSELEKGSWKLEAGRADKQGKSNSAASIRETTCFASKNAMLAYSSPSELRER